MRASGNNSRRIKPYDDKSGNNVNVRLSEKAMKRLREMSDDQGCSVTAVAKGILEDRLCQPIEGLEDLIDRIMKQ